MAKAPVRVAVSGAGGQIGYALLFRIAAGEMLGKDQPLILQLLEVPHERAQQALKGVMMELEDCAFPLLAGMIGTDNPKIAFKDADYALLVGAMPRGPGMERKDLLLKNATIFMQQGRALAEVASRDIHVTIVGNPANTNGLITMNAAKSLQRENFSSMMRLDLHRAISMLAAKAGEPVDSVERMALWGNHSPAMYPDIRFATIAGEEASKRIDETWYRDEFIPKVGKRGAAVIKARGLSSAASAANAIIAHNRDWALGSSGRWVSMGVASDGSYGIPEGLFFGMPCICDQGKWEVVKGLDIDPFSRQMMDRSLAELQEERDAVKHLFT